MSKSRIAIAIMTAALSIGFVQVAYAGCGCKAPSKRNPQGSCVPSDQQCNPNDSQCRAPVEQRNENSSDPKNVNNKQPKVPSTTVDPATGEPYSNSTSTNSNGPTSANTSLPNSEAPSAPVSLESAQQVTPPAVVMQTSGFSLLAMVADVVAPEAIISEVSEVAVNTTAPVTPGQSAPDGSGTKQPVDPVQSPGSTTHVQWMTNYNDAVNMAKQQNKHLLLFFTGSDWCGWCKKIESEVFATPDFARAAGSKFIFVMLDFPMNKPLAGDLTAQNNQLKQKFGVTGYPTVVVLDSNQNFVAETGYRPGGGAAYAAYLNQLVGG